MGSDRKMRNPDTKMVMLTFNTDEERRLLRNFISDASRVLGLPAGEDPPKGTVKFWFLQAMESQRRNAKNMTAEEKDAVRDRFEKFIGEKNRRKGYR